MNKTLLPHPFRIIHIKNENASTQTFILDGALSASPGQFVMAWLPDHEDKPFSLANSEPISLTIAAVGPFSQALHQLKVGNSIWLRGPLGQGYQLPTHAPGHILLIGGGYGVAPLLFLAQQALKLRFQVSVIIGARRKADLLLVDNFQGIDAALWTSTEDGSAGYQGVVTDVMPLVLAKTLKPQTVYTCGPTGMLKAVAALCQTKNTPVQVGWEARMRCGIGLCGSCEVGQGWLTCLDGPTFPFDPTKNSPPELIA